MVYENEVLIMVSPVAMDDDKIFRALISPGSRDWKFELDAVGPLTLPHCISLGVSLMTTGRESPGLHQTVPQQSERCDAAPIS